MNFGVLERESKGQVAWKSLIGPRVLASKSQRRADIGVMRTGRKDGGELCPAFAITMSMCVISFVASAATRAVASVSDSLERVNMWSLLSLEIGRAWSLSENVFKERTVAITVVNGRKRHFLASSRPIPVDVKSRDLRKGVT